MNYNPFSLEGKTILVTGASSGIGKATAIECSRLGAKVAITGRDEVRLAETFSALDGNGHLQFSADLTQEENITELVDKLPQLNGIVHAAGIATTIPFAFIKKKNLDSIFNINFFAPTILSQMLVKSKKIVNGGSIVFLSSIDGPVTAHAANSIYAASKGAVSAMSKNMAIDLASKKIRVNTILPGMTETPLIHGENFTDENFEADMKLYPLKRYGRPEEIAWAAVYFLSDASSFTTGTQLIVDGGFTIL